MSLALVLLVHFIIHAAIIFGCVMIAKRKGQSVLLGFLLGLFLWLIGLFIMLMLRDQTDLFFDIE